MDSLAIPISFFYDSCRVMVWFDFHLSHCFAISYSQTWYNYSILHATKVLVQVVIQLPVSVFPYYYFRFSHLISTFYFQSSYLVQHSILRFSTIKSIHYCYLHSQTEIPVVQIGKYFWNINQLKGKWVIVTVFLTDTWMNVLFGFIRKLSFLLIVIWVH